MRILTVALLLACCLGAYRWRQGEDSGDIASMANENGFVPVEMPDVAPQFAVLVLAPSNCPSEQAKRAEALIRHPNEEGIPVEKGDSISFDAGNPTAEQLAGIDRAIAVFKEGAPSVFVRGMAMSNPTPEQATAEYRRARNKG